MNPQLFPIRPLAALTAGAEMALDAETLASTQAILDDVRSGGDRALKRRIAQYEHRTPHRVLFDRNELEAAFGRLSSAHQGLLRRTADRIDRFARGQRACLQTMEMAIPGGRGGH